MKQLVAEDRIQLQFARQLVGRMGMWLQQKGPPTAMRHLALEDERGQVSQHWQIGQRSMKRFDVAVAQIRAVYDSWAVRDTHVSQ